MILSKIIYFRLSLVSCFCIMLMLLFSSSVYAQKNNEVVKIKTSAECDICKKNIEQMLRSEKGVKNAELDLDNRVVTVSYKPKKTNPDLIRKAISKIGYDADDIPADNKMLKERQLKHK